MTLKKTEICRLETNMRTEVEDVKIGWKQKTYTGNILRLETKIVRSNQWNAIKTKGSISKKIIEIGNIYRGFFPRILKILFNQHIVFPIPFHCFQIRVSSFVFELTVSNVLFQCTVSILSIDLYVVNRHCFQFMFTNNNFSFCRKKGWWLTW